MCGRRRSPTTRMRRGPRDAYYAGLLLQAAAVPVRMTRGAGRGHRPAGLCLWRRPPLSEEQRDWQRVSSPKQRAQRRRLACARPRATGCYITASARLVWVRWRPKLHPFTGVGARPPTAMPVNESSSERLNVHPVDPSYRCGCAAPRTSPCNTLPHSETA